MQTMEREDEETEKRTSLAASKRYRFKLLSLLLLSTYHQIFDTMFLYTLFADNQSLETKAYICKLCFVLLMVLHLLLQTP